MQPGYCKLFPKTFLFVFHLTLVGCYITSTVEIVLTWFTVMSASAPKTPAHASKPSHTCNTRTFTLASPEHAHHPFPGSISHEHQPIENMETSDSDIEMDSDSIVCNLARSSYCQALYFSCLNFLVMVIVLLIWLLILSLPSVVCLHICSSLPIPVISACWFGTYAHFLILIKNWTAFAFCLRPSLNLTDCFAFLLWMQWNDVCRVH